MSRNGMLVAVTFVLANLFTPLDCTCNNLAPGTGHMSLGVDVSELDMRSSLSSIHNGLKKPVIELTCNGNRTWRRSDGKTFQVPDQFSHISSNPTSSFAEQVHVYKTAEDVRDQLNVEASGTGVYKKIAFTKSISYSGMSYTITHKDRYVSEIFYKVHVCDAGFRDDVTPNKAVSDFTSRMSSEEKTFENHPEEYHDFVETYGTHYIDSASFGGDLSLRVETEASYFYTHSIEVYTSNVRVAFLNKFSLGGSVGEYSQSDIDEEFKSSSIITKYHKGGNVNFFEAEDVANWQSTVADNPALLSVRLKPISELISDSMVRDGVEKASQERVARSNLNEMKDLVKVERIKVGRFDIFDVFEAEITKLEKLPVGKFDLAGFENLANQISLQLNVPESFYTETKLCLKWNPLGDSGQCGGNIGREVCANAGSMTQHYMDNTDDRQGGCQMQWSIQSTAHETWFKEVQICYRWDDNGKGGQCFAQSAEVCSTVNNFTSVYLDQTNSNDGGCEISWRIKVPEEAPLWMRTALLCLDFYSDGDQGQCKSTEVGAKKCAMANAWTPTYPDNTDGRRGACYLSWGILPCCSEDFITINSAPTLDINFWHVFAMVVFTGLIMMYGIV